jgi:hypothetical protein
MRKKKYKSTMLALFAGLTLCLACSGTGYAEEGRHDVGVTVLVPGLAVTLGDDDFSKRWHGSAHSERSRFCDNAAHDCYESGHRDSRSCRLQWQYCTPD